MDEVRNRLQAARRVVVLTGAGISTDSGIPDFRGPNGVWTKNPAAERASYIQHWIGDAEARRAGWRMRLDSPVFRVEPNRGHLAIAERARRHGLHALITQNVDGLHQAAGVEPWKVIEVHGTADEWGCLDCGAGGPIQEALDRVRAGDDDPHCEVCGGIIKSRTISFGQNLVPEVIEQAQEESARADLFLALGTSLGVYPAAALPEIAIRAGSRLVVMNAQETPYDTVADAVVREPLGQVLPALAALGVGNSRPAK